MVEYPTLFLLPPLEQKPPSVARWIRDWTIKQAELARQLITVKAGLIPYDCKFKVTHRCNANCQMCLHPVKLVTDDTLASRELSDFEVRRIIPELAESGSRSIHFSGGEPLLRIGLERFVKEASRNGLRAKLTTNGTLVTEKRALALAGAKLRSVNISLDGPSASIHDKIRGVKGFFDRTTRGIQAFVSARESRGRPHVRINTVISHGNCHQLAELLDLATELNVNAIHLLPVDFAHADPSLALTPDDYELVKEIISSRDHDIRLLGDNRLLAESLLDPKTRENVVTGQYALGYYDSNPCYAPFMHLFIMPEGEVYTCCFVERSKENCLASVRYQSIREIWNSTSFQELRRKALTSPLYPACHSCDHFLEINREIEKHMGPKGCRTSVENTGSQGQKNDKLGQ